MAFDLAEGKSKRGGARPGAGRKKREKVPFPAGRPTNPDVSTIRNAYDLLDANLYTLLQEGITMALTAEDEKVRGKLISDLVGKRMPTATGVVDLTDPMEFDDEALDEMSFEELETELKKQRDSDCGTNG